MSAYSAVLKEEGDASSQAYEDVPQAKETCDRVKDYLNNFGVEDHNVFELSNPTAAKTEQTYKTIASIVDQGRAKSPPENHLIVHCFVGQGVEMHGSQHLLFNEFDSQTSFYKTFPAEKKMRVLADTFANLYQIGMFGCSRTEFQPGAVAYFPNRDAEPEPQKPLSQSDTLEACVAGLPAPEKRTGNNIGTNVARENLLLISASRNDLAVSGGIDMVQSLLRTFVRGLHHETLSVQFPKVLETMHGDARFTYSASNTIQPMKIFYEQNIATTKVAMILVNTKAKALPWKNAGQNGQAAAKLFKESLGFDEVEVHVDLSKAAIIERFDALQAKADHFDKDKVGKETMLIGVMWIGHTWYGNGHHRQYGVAPPDAAPARCADGTVCPNTHGVTTEGDPICIYEYISRLCRGERTHILYVLDWFSLHLGQLNAAHLNATANFWELKLDDHRGWPRMNCVNTGVGEFCDYFRKQRELHDQNVFMFPFHLDAGAFNPTTWRSVKAPEQVVVDVRSETMKDFTRKGQPTRTLKNTFEVWNDKPQLVASELVDSSGIWNQSVDYLKECSQIVHICMGADNATVDFVFHNARHPFAEVQRCAVQRQHYRFAIIAKNFTGTPQRRKLTALFFANGCNKTPSKTIQFTREHGGEPWQTPPAEWPVACEGNFSEVFRHAFLVSTFDGDEHLLVLRDEHVLIFDRDMHMVSRLNYAADVHRSLIQCYICAPDYQCDGSTFLMTFQVGTGKVTEEDTDHIYQGNTMQNTWCMRWKFDAAKLKVGPCDMKTQSLLFKTEAIQGACEYAKNQFIFYGRQEHLFLVKDWEVTRRINDPDSKNINKYSLSPLEGFDLDTFPFVVTSGESTFNLVNVRTGHMEVLIKAATSVLHAQTAIFYVQEGDGPVSAHFATTRTTEENKTQQNWFAMSFKQDFVDCLKRYGRLPIKSPEEALKIYAELQALKARM